ncbi:MAG TPA: DUF5777 family beta-barrel protein [Thermoanaerobaculia bacterium]|nr:DUF5777 family beta-barrel protein [Thermoanaerobaculia bacterium]
MKSGFGTRRLRRRLVAILLLGAAPLLAQDAPTSTPPRAPEGSRIINLPSVEVPAAGNLGVLFFHRFKQALGESSVRDFFSLDSGADTVLGVSYSPLDRLEVSLDRSSIEADFELSVKYRVLSMQENRPFALAVRVGGDAVTKENVENREGFFAQGIASIAIGSRIRATVVPTYVSETALFQDVFSAPVALSISLTRTVNVHGEVYPKNRDFTETPSRRAGPGVTPRPGRQTHIGWNASIEKTVLRHRFAFTVGNMRGSNVDQYTASDLGGAGIPHDVYLGFNLVRQWKLK